MGRPGNCQSTVLAIENVDECQSIVLLVSFDGIHVYQCRSSSRSHTFYHHVQHCSGGMGFESIWLETKLNQANALYPSQHSHFSLIHQHFILLFHCPAFSPICHSMSYNSLIDVMFELDGYFLVMDDSSDFSPFVPG